MVTPMMGLHGGLFHTSAPAIIKDYYYKYWWFLLFLFLAVCLCEIVAIELFEAIFSAILAMVIWYMAKENFAHMTPHCLLMFGIICGIQAVFGFLLLVGSVKGRRTTRIIRPQQYPSQGPGAVPHHSMHHYATSVEIHPFFDPTMGLLYNMQSTIKILSPVTMLCAVLLTYTSYKVFPSMDEEIGPVMAAGPHMGVAEYGGAAGHARRRQHQDGPLADNGFGRYGLGAPQGFQGFQGVGQRLGAPVQRLTKTNAGAVECGVVATGRSQSHTMQDSPQSPAQVPVVTPAPVSVPITPPAAAPATAPAPASPAAAAAAPASMPATAPATAPASVPVPTTALTPTHTPVPTQAPESAGTCSHHFPGVGQRLGTA